MRLRCYECGKSVSTEVPDDTVVRAVLTCPECIEKEECKHGIKECKVCGGWLIRHTIEWDLGYHRECCTHEWEWYYDWNHQRYGICKKCKEECLCVSTESACKKL